MHFIAEFREYINRMENSNHIFTIEDGVIKVKGIYAGIPFEKSVQILLEQGFTMASSSEFKGDIEGLGICSLRFRVIDSKITSIMICTERECTEEMVLNVFEHVSNDLHASPRYDYNGYGVVPKRHEIDHFWDLNEGFLTIEWDGFNTHIFSFRKGDGLDPIRFCLRGPVVKDEAYWRSEVD